MILKKNKKTRIKFPCVNEESYRWAWHKSGPIGVIVQFCRNIKYQRERAIYGYSKYDLYDIQHWFTNVVPNMLEEYRDNRVGSPGILGENYVNEQGCYVNDTCHEEWTKILNEMIFLFREADEEKCTRKNPYEDEYTKALDEFTERYGLLGIKLMTEEEKEKAKNGKGYVVHGMDELPEYADIQKKYMEANRLLEEYREECKNKAFELFSKWFYSLWD